MHNRDRRRLIQFLSLGAISYPASSAAFFFFDDEPEPAPKPAPSIFRMQGQISINGRPAQDDSEIIAGDVIQTGENSEIVFRHGIDAHMLRSNTTFELAGNNNVVDTLRILSGAILSVFGSGQKTILTPTATIGIRGTGTYFEVAQDETYLCTCYGKTEIAATDDPGVREDISTTHHESPRFIRKQNGKSIIKEAPVRNHSDAELIMLESTVGREPPFACDSFDPLCDEYSNY